jgi:hypothetical protein
MFDVDILIKVWPMNTSALRDQSPIAALVHRGVDQSWEPINRH